MVKVLIIDDDRDLHRSLGWFLEQEGFEVCSAYDADEGLERIKSEAPDVAILDVLMPTEYEGFAVAQAVREELGLRDLPIIILSAVHEVRKVPYRFAPDETYLPVDVFLDKPVDPAHLCAKVRELLGEGPPRVEDEPPL